MTRMTEADVRAHQLRARAGSPSATDAKPPVPRSPSKYRAQPCVIDGQRFASKAEGRRYQELAEWQACGIIRGLRIHTRWPLRLEGTLLCVYVSDFDYWREGRQVVEDVKGGKSLPLFKLKSKLFSVLYHPLKIAEIRIKVKRGSR